MKQVRNGWLLLFTLMAIPYLALFVAGSIWLYERGLLVAYLVFSGVLMLVGTPIMRWVRRRSRPRPIGVVKKPDGTLAVDGVTLDVDWSPLAWQAWEKVGVIAERVRRENPPLDQPDVLWSVLREVLETVAHTFHPNTRRAALEISLPQVLFTVELVSRDLRAAFSEHVPGSHILTLADFRRIQKLAWWGQQAYFLYRIAAFGVNPLGGIAREIRDAATNDMLATSTDDVKQWVIGFCVRKAGFYAIEMYSGRLVMDEAGLREFQSARTQRDVERAGAVDERLAEEPLRILVLGQVKAGKSSLVNALFGEVRAAVDVVPRTRSVEPYVLQREGIPRAVILDTAGYDEGEQAANVFKTFKEHLLNCDLVLMAVSARSASRAADRRLLDELRAFFQSQPDRIMPPVVVALTHIDQLRPLAEWNPPYDLTSPQGTKAANIADAVAAVSEDLALGPDDVLVPVVLKPERMYNVEEGLAPAILNEVPEAHRVRYLRALREFHDADYWQRLWRQALNSGRVLLRMCRKR